MVYLLGCDHWLQEPELSGPSIWAEVDRTPKARRQRELFRAEVEGIIRSGPVDFIGEETKQNLTTPAKQLCAKYGFTYRNIDMPLEERRQQGIPEPVVCDRQYKHGCSLSPT